MLHFVRGLGVFSRNFPRLNVLLLIPLIFAEYRLIRSSSNESFDVRKTEINASKLPDRRCKVFRRYFVLGSTS